MWWRQPKLALIALPTSRHAFVARRHQDVSDEERLELLRGKIAELIQAAATVGASEGELKEEVERALAASPLLGS